MGHSSKSRPLRTGWGARARLGFIELSTSIAVSAEAPSVLPEGVTALMSRMRLPDGEVSAEALGRMIDSDRLEEASAELADADATVVAFACTTGSLIGGVGFDRELIERMERGGGVRATTTSTALLAALRALGAERVAVATPYVDELNRLEVDFLQAQGHHVTAVRGLNIASDPQIAEVAPERTRELAISVANQDSSADVVFISCTNLLTLDSLDQLERELGKPVVSSVAVTIWHALVLAGIEPDAAGAGSLLAGRLPVTADISSPAA